MKFRRQHWLFLFACILVFIIILSVYLPIVSRGPDIQVPEIHVLDIQIYGTRHPHRLQGTGHPGTRNPGAGHPDIRYKTSASSPGDRTSRYQETRYWTSRYQETRYWTSKYQESRCWTSRYQESRCWTSRYTRHSGTSKYSRVPGTQIQCIQNQSFRYQDKRTRHPGTIPSDARHRGSRTQNLIDKNQEKSYKDPAGRLQTSTNVGHTQTITGYHVLCKA